MSKTYLLSDSALSEVLKSRKPAASMADLEGVLAKAGPKPKPIQEKLLKYVVNPQSGCWEWNGATNDSGYGLVSLTGGRKVAAHRASWILHRGTIPGRLHVCHDCDNPPCVNPEHLFLGTWLDNGSDASIKGRLQCGEARWNSVLTDGDVVRIRQLGTQISAGQIAKQFGVCRENISAILRRALWKHIP